MGNPSFKPFRVDRVNPRLFSKNDHHSHLQRTVWVDPITLGANDHHGHLEGSLDYPRPLTLPQNSIRSLCGDVRPDLCQSGLFSVPAGSICAFRVCSTKNSPNPTQQRSNLTSNSPIPHLGTRSLPIRSIGSLALSGFLYNPGRSRELVDTGYRPR
ncbi:hypothetical protein CRG98_006554 [Punica granatum]|uniref:Uncharacterized protein n=1 Tax=Punica granatum TaxID=22663 RepID=A0A2I0KX73_PUNGR|nr:hypothetical protein CRG98_006554 [Punica granatum]